MTTADIKALYQDNDALGLAAHLRNGDVSAAEIVETAIEAIEALNPSLNAVVLKTYDMARKGAAQPLSGPFGGVPFPLKNIDTQWEGTPIDNAVPYLQGQHCQYDTELARRTKQAGFVVLGRTNAPQTGWSLGTEPRLYGPTKNPWKDGLTPGGSSGGAAAAVSSRMMPIAEASDGGGSTRGPASCCNLVGLKPSRGRITFGPQMPDFWLGSPSIFCISRTVRDTAAFLDATAGTLPGDPYHAPMPDTSWLEQSAKAPARLRIGYTQRQAWGAPVAPQVATAMQATLRLLEHLGHALEEHDLAVDLEATFADYNLMNAAESVAEYDGHAELIGRPVREDDLEPINWALAERGRTLSAADHVRTTTALRQASHHIARDIVDYDVYLTPTLTQLPRPIGYWSMAHPDLDAYLDRWQDGGYLFCFNLSGLPAISVPVVVTDDGVPIGMQMVGRHGDEATLLRLAQQMQDELRWQDRRPPIGPF
jgi:amidase